MATYYAQTSGVSVTTAGMWNSAPGGGGTAYSVTLQSGSTYGITGDAAAVLVLNGKNVTINVSLSVGQIRNDVLGLSAGVVAGGTATLSDGVTLTADIQGGGSAYCVQLTGSVSATIVGSSTGSNASGSFSSVYMNSTGVLTFSAVSITGSSASTAFPGASAINCNAGTSNITAATIVGGSSSGQAAISGIGGSSAIANITVSGGITGGSANLANGIDWRSNSSLTIGGSVTGNVGPGLNCQGGGTVIVNGTATGGAAAGVSVSQSTPVTITRVKGGPNSTSAPGVAAGTTGNVTITEAEYGAAGASPTTGAVKFNNSSSQATVTITPTSGSARTLIDTASSASYPTESDVRNNVLYGGSRYGTCRVPAAASVLAGVLVDNTVGTAAVSSASIQSACDAALAAFSGGRLANVATVASTGQQIADATV